MNALFPMALGLLLQSTALLLAGLVAMRLTRRRGPAVQSLIGRATLAGVALALLLAGPLAGHVRPVWKVTVGEPAPRQVAAPPETGRGGVRIITEGYPVDEAYAHHATLPNAPSEAPADPAPARPLRLNPATTLSAPSPPPPVSGGAATCRGVGSLWAAGTALLLLWLTLCQCHLTRLRRQAAPIASGPAAETLADLTTRPPLLLAHPSVRSPFLTGVRHPAIFLPTAHETEFDPPTLRAILAHELAHLARRDNAWTLAARLLTALLWPQPLLWVLCRRLEQTSEETCDLAVLAQNCPPRAYADCLLTLAERHPLGRRERALGVGVAPFRSSLGRRIGRILDKGTHAMSAVTLHLRLTVAALAVAAALGGVFLVSSAPAQSPAPITVTPNPEQERFHAMQIHDAMNLRDIGIALTQYLQDHNWRFPNAAHWMDALSPYLKDKTVFFDPSQPGARRYGYALNRNCSGKSLAAIGKPQETVFVFDSTLSTRNANDTGQSLRAIPEGTTSGSNYVFVDGHVKWFRKAYQPPYALNRRMSRPQADEGYISQLSVDKKPVGPARVTIRPDTELSNARFLAGLTPVQGPGVVVTLRDSKKSLPAMPGGFAPPSIIHDSDINQVVNELKAAGAEAVAVNGQRLVATSSIRCAGPTVFVNNMPTPPPFVVKAIGDPKALAAALNLPGGVASQIKAYDPAMFSVREAGTLKLPAYTGSSEPRYARPLEKEAALRGDINFLAKQIADLQARRRLAEEAVLSYKAHHKVKQDQRKLADLMRDYSNATAQDKALRQVLRRVTLQLDLTHVQTQQGQH